MIQNFCFVKGLIQIKFLVVVVLTAFCLACGGSKKKDFPEISIESPLSLKTFYTGKSIFIKASLRCEANITAYQISLVSAENSNVVTTYSFTSNSKQIEVENDFNLPESLVPGDYFLKIKAFSDELFSSEFVAVKVEKGKPELESLYISQHLNNLLLLKRIDLTAGTDSLVFQFFANEVTNTGITSDGKYYFMAADNGLVRANLLTFTEQILHPQSSLFSEETQFAKMRDKFLYAKYNGSFEIYSEGELYLTQSISKMPIDCAVASNNFFVLGKDAIGFNSTIYQFNYNSTAQFASFNINHQVVAIDAINDNLLALLWLNADSTMELATLNCISNEVTSAKSFPKGEILKWIDLGGNGIAIKKGNELWLFNPSKYYLPQVITTLQNDCLRLTYLKSKGAICYITPFDFKLIDLETANSTTFNYSGVINVGYGY